AARAAAERLRVVADRADHADRGHRGLYRRGPVLDPGRPGVLAPAPGGPRSRDLPGGGHPGRGDHLTGPPGRPRPSPTVPGEGRVRRYLGTLVPRSRDGPPYWPPAGARILSARLRIYSGCASWEEHR